MSGRTALGDKAVRPWWLGRTAIGFLNGNERIALSLIVQNEHNVYRVAPNSISRLQFLKYGFHMSLCHIKDILGVVLRSVSITIVQSICLSLEKVDSQSQKLCVDTIVRNETSIMMK